MLSLYDMSPKPLEAISTLTIGWGGMTIGSSFSFLQAVIIHSNDTMAITILLSGKCNNLVFLTLLDMFFN